MSEIETAEPSGRQGLKNISTKLFLAMLLALLTPLPVISRGSKVEAINLNNRLVQGNTLVASSMPPQSEDNLSKEQLNASQREISQYIHHIFGKYGSQATKIAFCESGLNSEAVNRSDAQITGKVSTGLFQHNDGFYDGWDNYRVSTQRAYEKFQERGWYPWYNCAVKLGYLK